MAGWVLYGRNSVAPQRTAGVRRYADEQHWHNAALLQCSVSRPARSPAYASSAAKPVEGAVYFLDSRSPASACGTPQGRMAGVVAVAGDHLTAASEARQLRASVAALE
jgi:hypothetical protein